MCTKENYRWLAKTRYIFQRVIVSSVKFSTGHLYGICFCGLISSGSMISVITNMCFILVTFSPFTACLELFSLCRELASNGKSVERQRDRRQEKENIFGAMCCRSKTWQSHDQRHLIILELQCSFNPSERTIFYWGRRAETMLGWQTELKKQ